MGVIAPLDDSNTTHGICGDCTERFHREELRGRRRVVIVVRRNRRDLLERLEGAYAGFEDVTVRMDARTRERRQPSREPPRGNRRRGDRRRRLFPSQLAAWEALGIFVSERRG
jgi:hypothetical protein